MKFCNIYEEACRATAYDELELGGTYHLVFRDQPGLLSECVTGRLVNIVSTPEIYTNEWVTFSTRDFPENASARSGDVVRIVTTTYSDNRPVDDILWADEDYRAVFGEAGLEVERVERPLGRDDEDIPWVSETKIAPWAIYILNPVD